VEKLKTIAPLDNFSDNDQDISSMRRQARPIYFVCAAVSPEAGLLIKMISATSTQQAIDEFHNQFLLLPQEVLGPFYKKRTRILETTRQLKFSNEVKKASFNGWIVNAFLLQEPSDQAYLVFLQREDGKLVTPPSGTITVPISELFFHS
jgi:hypothetical protein